MSNSRDIISQLIFNAINDGSQLTVEQLYDELTSLLNEAGRGLTINKTTRQVNTKRNAKQLRSKHFIAFYNKTSVYVNNLYI